MNGENPKKNRLKKIIKKAHHYSKALFWFLVGFTIAGLTIVSILIIIFHNSYRDRAIPGIYIDNVNVSNKTENQIISLYDKKNKTIQNSIFTFTYNDNIATVSAKTLNIGYNSKLIADQAVSLGKSPNLFTNIFIVLNSYLNGTTLNSSYTFDQDKFSKILNPLAKSAYVAPINAVFQVENNRVTTFKQSATGKKLDIAKAIDFMDRTIPKVIRMGKSEDYTFEIPQVTLEPDVTTKETNSFGIVEEIGEGTSLFHHSIDNRIHNIAVASSKVTGILVKPGEEFSFDKYLGDVSAATGYDQAYVIQNGKTILGDGGGVCQVSTTLFRAILNAGLPITERHAHAYRVGYYEEDSPPGFDATVFYPSVDLKFVNDTGNYILIQSIFDSNEQRLTYVLYGKKDGRSVDITTPVVTGYKPAPDPLYQDDPTIPKGTTKQVDFAAAGATATFHRTVRKNGKIIIDENYVSRYAPWQAVFLVGTG